MPEESTSTPASRRRRIAVKLAVSAALLFHLIALIGPPLSLQSQGPMGSSPSVSLLMQPVRWYCQSFYLDRGYAFFAPDPGPSHLIQAATTQPDGSRTEQMYPDRELQCRIQGASHVGNSQSLIETVRLRSNGRTLFAHTTSRVATPALSVGKADPTNYLETWTSNPNVYL